MVETYKEDRKRHRTQSIRPVWAQHGFQFGTVISPTSNLPEVTGKPGKLRKEKIWSAGQMILGRRPIVKSKRDRVPSEHLAFLALTQYKQAPLLNQLQVTKPVTNERAQHCPKPMSKTTQPSTKRNNVQKRHHQSNLENEFPTQIWSHLEKNSTLSSPKKARRKGTLGKQWEIMSKSDKQSTITQPMNTICPSKKQQVSGRSCLATDIDSCIALHDDSGLLSANLPHISASFKYDQRESIDTTVR